MGVIIMKFVFGNSGGFIFVLLQVMTRFIQIFFPIRGLHALKLDVFFCVCKLPKDTCLYRWNFQTDPRLKSQIV